uniref:Uncharacterized protein n=1 Tax=Tanacetum cinerariifolium TaxID=118510 RepID=A0A699GWI5_TANCI|nr:hypothetical protein [Tanacetum cinerariifolium]
MFPMLMSTLLRSFATVEDFPLLHEDKNYSETLWTIKGVLRLDSTKPLVKPINKVSLIVSLDLSKVTITLQAKALDPSFRIQQVEVIEFGNSYKAPPEENAKDKGLAGEVSASTKMKGRTLRFSKYDYAKELWEALKTFGGNKATKKTKKNQLKQQYGNFKAEGSEILKQTFNRLRAIVSHLEFMDVPIEQDDLNQKFLTSLAPEWLVYIIVWRNRDDLDTVSLDDVYNYLKVYEPEVQKRVSLSYDTMCAFIVTQPNGSQIKYEDISQIDDDDIEEMDIKWNLALLSMRADRFWKKTSKKITIQGSNVVGFDKSKVECFNFFKMGHFARECRSPRSLDRGKRESYKKDPKVEEPAPKAMIAIDGIRWGWSYMAEEDKALKNHALMADEE